jgi:hypothetical protein
LDFHYSVFGLRLRSNLPLPGLPTSNSANNDFDVVLYLGKVPQIETPLGPEELTYTSTEANAAGEPALRIFNGAENGFVHVVYEDGTEFWVDSNRQRIWATWTKRSSFENAISYLSGQILGLVLRLRGVTCLHASAIAVGDRSIAFVGTTGAGKSTTAAAFARQGFSVLSDDIVALSENDNGFRVLPGYPHLCLWPPSTKIFHDSPESLPRIVPDDEKRLLVLGEEVPRFESRPLPLGAIYFLGERRSESAPCIETMRAQAALLALVAETYANKILDRELRAREFAVLSRLVEEIPIRRVIPHSDLSRTEDLCRLIAEELTF